LLENILPHHEIFYHVMEYFATSWNILLCHKTISMWQKIYQKYSMTFLKNSMPWNGIFFKIPSCSHEQVHLLARSPISVIGKNLTSIYFENDVLAFWCTLHHALMKALGFANLPHYVPITCQVPNGFITQHQVCSKNMFLA